MSGQVRRFRHNWNNLNRHIIEPNRNYFNNINIIVTTWSDWDRQQHSCYPDTVKQTIDVTKEELSQYPIHLELIDFPDELKQYENFDAKHQIMFYSWMKNWESLQRVRKVNDHFDIIMRTRSDLWYKEHLDYNQLDILENASCKICIPQGSDYMGINDQFAIGPSYLMETYMNIYNKTSFIQNKPEVILQDHLRKYNLPICRFAFNYEILR